MDIQQKPSPNFSSREKDIRYVIVHCTEVANDDDALNVYLDPQAELSCHYYICYDGTPLQLVDDEKCAWHAGISIWADVEGLNKYSIGIEIGNPGEDGDKIYTEEQYKTLEALLEKLMKTYGIPPENILGHSDIAAWRKRDPGKHFDWPRLEAKGLAAPFKFPQTAGNALEALYHWGYHGDEPDVVAAFQRRYLPDNVTGVLDEKTKAFIRAAE